MQKMIKSFKVNPDIVYDTIDGEVILLDVERGNYFQLKNEAVKVWEVITSQKKSSAQLVADILAKQSKYSLDDVFCSINPFIEQLKTEQILVDAKQTKSKIDKIQESKLSAKNHKSKFPSPVLLKYTDMQSILLLDPIHDTDEKGWPNKKSKSA